MIAAVMTSMGRLEHVKLSLPALLRHTRMDLVLVDYDCPDGTADWVSAHVSEWPRGRDRVHIVRAGPIQRRPRGLSRVRQERADARVFSKPRALNAGLDRAFDIGAEFVCLIDADTVVLDGRFEAFVGPRVAADKFIIAETHPDFAELTGFLVAPLAAIHEIGGFDEHYEGWGAEDLDVRLRLFLGAGLAYEEMPPELLASISHSDSERTRFYREKNKFVSHARNAELLVENACRLARASFDEVFGRPEIQRLIRCYYGVPSGAPKEDPTP